MAALLKAHVPPGSELVVASTWGPQFTDFLRGQAGAGAFDLMALSAHTTALNRSYVPEQAERVFIADLHGAQERAGHGTLLALNQEARITGAAPRATVAGQRRYPHHLCHAAYGLWGSPFETATALVVDGMGETGAAAIYRLEGGRITELRRHRGRGSLGFLYGLITDLAGFDQVKGEEWKIMGLAPTAVPTRTSPPCSAGSARSRATACATPTRRRSGRSPRRSAPAAPRMPWRRAGPTSPAAARTCSRR